MQSQDALDILELLIVHNKLNITMVFGALFSYKTTVHTVLLERAKCETNTTQ